MIKRLFRQQPLLMIVPQQLVQEIDRLVRDVALVLRSDETLPRFASEATEDVVEFGREVNVVLFEVSVEVVRSEYFANLD